VAPFVLSDRPATTKTFKDPHYLMPDTNALLNGMDLFEQTTAFYDVIILQTVLEELKNRSIPIYNRLLGLVKSADKRFYLFFNEFRMETYVERGRGETINDRNDRAIRRAAQWYGEHLKLATKGLKRIAPSIVVLTDDKENARRCKDEGVIATALTRYVEVLDDADRLLDMIIEAKDGKDYYKAPKAELYYPEYWSMSKMMTGIKSGTLHQGIFNVSPYNYLEGAVHVPAFEKSLLILGRENSNRAVSGDVAVVEVLPKDQWKAPSEKIVDEETLNKNDNAEVEEDEAVIAEQERRTLQEDVKKAHEKGAEARAQPTARVVGVMKRNWRQYVGHVDNQSASSSVKQGRRQTMVFLIPMDKRIPKIRVRTRQADELMGKRILVTIDTWDRDSRYPMGHYVRSLGELESKGAETEAILLEYDVQYRPFPTGVLDCLPKEGHDWRVTTNMDDPGWKGRQDLRHLLVCSIDPPNCQDIDDALHARPLPNGNIEVGVHIADVSHFVKPNNAMDLEASMRGTTVYLVDKRIDMLPMLLGTDLCSLKPNIERYAFSIIWELNPKDASVISSTFTKSVILSKNAFSYEQAQIRIDDPSQTDSLTQSMRTLLRLSIILRQKRMDAGALNLASPEVRIETDSETSDPLNDVKTKALLATNSLVEEFMLLANTTVAAKIYSSFPHTALLRRHAAPPATNFSDLAAQLSRKRNSTLDVSSSAALAASLDKCIDPTHPFFNTLIRILATRCMTSAEYFAAGEHAIPEFHHYGLASHIYTHFTSPIRRYADLLVHRQLAASIGYESLALGDLRSKSRLDAVVKNLNIRHRNAQLAGRASIEYYVGQALKNYKPPPPPTSAKTSTPGIKATNTVPDDDDGIGAEAYILRVFENGIVAFIPRFGIEGIVRLEDFKIRGDKGGKRESLFEGEDWRLSVWEKGNEDGKVVVELFEMVRVVVRSVKGTGRGEGKRKVGVSVIGK
jgi:exosome complex exonuclease DIS3/RRP44